MKEQAEKVIEILKKTESNLQEVIIEAAKVGDYRTVDIARVTAVNVKNLRMQIISPVNNKEEGDRKDKSHIRRKTISRKAKKSDYPKFIIKDDMLIRIGWSKKQKREYTHKVPRYIFDKTKKAMVLLAQSGNGPFLAEQIIEHANSNKSESIPSYQIYAIIGLLRQTNCIKQAGRNGYFIPPDIGEKADERWKEFFNKRK